VTTLLFLVAISQVEPRPQIDFPRNEAIANIGSRVDGAGMCVMSSIEMAARWAGLEQMRGLRDWCAKEPGGAYPSKVTRQIRGFCLEKKIDQPNYIQYEGPNSQVIEMTIGSGRMPAITWGPAHMVAGLAMDKKRSAILDNNAIDRYPQWYDTPKFEKSWRGGGKNGWIFLWVDRVEKPFVGAVDLEKDPGCERDKISEKERITMNGIDCSLEELREQLRKPPTPIDIPLPIPIKIPWRWPMSVDLINLIVAIGAAIAGYFFRRYQDQGQKAPEWLKEILDKLERNK